MLKAKEMAGSRLFWKIFLVYALFLVASAGLFVAFVVNPLRSTVREQANGRLREAAHLLRDSFAGNFPHDPSEALQNRLRDLQSMIGTRLTVVSDDGTVVGDSESQPSSMDNHGDRDEIQAARSSETGEGLFDRIS